MENVTKALLIIAGVFLAMMILSLLVLFYSRISDFYAQQHELTMIEQNQEFNSRFENYNGREIRGNELISVMNRIIDYNNLYADLQDYKRIIITIDLDFMKHIEELTHDGKYRLFVNYPIQNVYNDDSIKKIANVSVDLVTELSDSGISGITDAKLQKLSSQIENIVNNGNVAYRNQKLEQILGYIPSNEYIIKNTIVPAIKKYNEYTIFKRAMFKCTEVTYDLDTRRVNGIKFEAIEKGDKLVLE